MTTLKGHDAITAKTRDRNICLCKYSDPVEPFRPNISLEQALDIADEDVSLIFAEIHGYDIGSNLTVDFLRKNELIDA